MRETLNQLRLRLKAMLRQRQLDRDLDDEMAFHLAMREQANRASGLTPDDARMTARKQFGRQPEPRAPIAITAARRRMRMLVEASDAAPSHGTCRARSRAISRVAAPPTVNAS